MTEARDPGEPSAKNGANVRLVPVTFLEIRAEVRVAGSTALSETAIHFDVGESFPFGGDQHG
jgi:hypothetical protein